MAKVVIVIRVRWWLIWYLHGVSLMCQLTGRDPNWDKVDKWISRAIYFK